MDSSDGSETEDEISEIMIEAANCDYVNKLYNNKYFEEKESSVKHAKETDLNVPDISSHQVFVAKTLAKKLDKLVKVIEPSDSEPFCAPVSSPAVGIRLLSDSVVIDELEEVKISHRSKPPLLNDLSENEIISRANEAAVTTEWVLSKENTAYWRFFKPKVILMKVTKQLDDRTECVVLGEI